MHALHERQVLHNMKFSILSNCSCVAWPDFVIAVLMHCFSVQGRMTLSSHSMFNVLLWIIAFVCRHWCNVARLCLEMLRYGKGCKCVHIVECILRVIVCDSPQNYIVFNECVPLATRLLWVMCLSGHLTSNFECYCLRCLDQCFTAHSGAWR